MSTTAWSRARTHRRRCNAMLVMAVMLLTAFFGPNLAANMVDAFERHILAEGRGDTAQAVASKVGWAIARDPMRPDALVLTPNGTGECEVAPLYIEVDCGTVIKYWVRNDADQSYVVVAERHDEEFRWDSSKVAAVIR